MKRVLQIAGGLLAAVAALIAGYMGIYWAPDRPVDELKARWAPPPSQFVDIAGLQVHLRDEGPRDDPSPVVLLHGTSASLHTWDGWAAGLKDRRRVIRYDMHGFGLTGPAPDGVYTIQSYARLFAAVLDALDVQRCVLAGNSLGGYVAWAATVLNPQRIDRLILVDAGGYPYVPKTIPLGWRIVRTPVLGRLFSQVLPRRVVERSTRAAYGDPSKVTPEVVDRYYELTLRAGNRAALRERFRQAQPGVLTERIPEITAPTLILWGGRDGLVPPELGQRFDREIPDSRLVVFDELGHVPHEEDPARTLAPVREFLGG